MATGSKSNKKLKFANPFIKGYDLAFIDNSKGI